MSFARDTTIGVVRAGSLDGALRPRLVGMAESLAGPAWFAAILEAGRVSFSGEDCAIDGPVLLWRPWGQQNRASFGAGASGVYVVLGATALANAAGYMPETRELRETADSAVTIPLAQQGAETESLLTAFRGLHTELSANDPAAHAIVGAYLRIVLVQTYRGAIRHDVREDHASPSHRVFARYGALVEANFRKRWSVTTYAEELGVTRDRLGDICRRVRGLGPKELIDRRIALEARLQLENSSSSLEQIAGLLGFTTAAQFNRFFHRAVGTTPGAYRSSFLKGVRESVSSPARPYQWP